MKPTLFFPLSLCVLLACAPTPKDSSNEGPIVVEITSQYEVIERLVSAMNANCPCQMDSLTVQSVSFTNNKVVFLFSGDKVAIPTDSLTHISVEYATQLAQRIFNEEGEAGPAFVALIRSIGGFFEARFADSDSAK